VAPRRPLDEKSRRSQARHSPTSDTTERSRRFHPSPPVTLSEPTEGVRLIQRVERDPEGKILTVAIRIEVPPSFPEKYHEALVRVAAKCAVKKTIESPPQFAISTVVISS
jgi:hypothetical protein